jgi:hypothetical protein
MFLLVEKKTNPSKGKYKGFMVFQILCEIIVHKKPVKVSFNLSIEFELNCSSLISNHILFDGPNLIMKKQFFTPASEPLYEQD